MIIDNGTDYEIPTLMHNVYDNLIGESVIVYIDGSPHPLGGKLAAHNGYVVHLITEGGIRNLYIPSDKVIAIGSDK